MLCFLELLAIKMKGKCFQQNCQIKKLELEVLPLIHCHSFKLLFLYFCAWHNVIFITNLMLTSIQKVFKYILLYLFDQISWVDPFLSMP